MRYDPQHKERTRERVLKEAAKAIRAEGPHRVGVAAVMSKAGLTHGGFYAHFPSKDVLVAEAIAQMFSESAAKFDVVTAGKPPAEALAAYVDFYLSAGHRDALNSGCPLPALSADLPRLTVLARERFAMGVARLTGRLSERLSALGRPEPDALASSAVAELVGALSLSRAVPERAASDDILAHSKQMLKQRLGVEGLA